MEARTLNLHNESCKYYSRDTFAGKFFLSNRIASLLFPSCQIKLVTSVTFLSKLKNKDFCEPASLVLYTKLNNTR